MKKLQNKVIWITGASSGIGKELAIQLSANNNQLILSARNKEALSELKSECEVKGVQAFILPLDLADSAHFDLIAKEAAAAFGKIDVLINNGGISQRSFAAETPLSVDRTIMEVNFFGTVALTKAVIPYMLAQKSGQLAVISSLSGKFGWPERSAYAASKHALQGFFETLGIELKSANIGVTIISPGRVNTPISMSALTKDGTAHGKYDKGQQNGVPVVKCASKIINALEKGKRELIIAKEERIVYWLHSLSKKLFYSLASKVNPNS
jgi:dehydrogenase/reductase SDR family protein 7B